MQNVAAIAAEVEQELRSILKWWSAKSVDLTGGGFHGEIDARDEATPGAPKGVVLNARLLWFFSAAAIHLDDPAARMLADRARDYVRARFLDGKHGGVWWKLDAQGRPLDRRKQAYAQAFAAYAFSEHYRLSSDAASLSIAHEIFMCVEAHYRDRRQGGYLEARGEAWTPIEDVRLSEQDLNAPKSMNTHLHILEAYTALHRVAPSALTSEALAGAIGLMTVRFIDPKSQHLRMFFDMDWTQRSQAISFGHDIEASWLLWEAAQALGDQRVTEHLEAAVLGLARACLSEGLSAQGNLYNEQLAGRLDARSVWWAQAEAMVGFLNAYELSGEPIFFEAFERVWAFIKRWHRAKSGEWTWWSSRDGGDAYKAGFWKCPYHNGRAMMETSRRLARLHETRGGAV